MGSLAWRADNLRLRERRDEMDREKLRLNQAREVAEKRMAEVAASCNRAAQSASMGDMYGVGWLPRMFGHLR